MNTDFDICIEGLFCEGIGDFSCKKLHVEQIQDLQNSLNGNSNS